VEGQVAISNRIFEIWFYNLFIAEEAINSKTYDAGERDKNQFVSKDRLNMDLVLKKFVQHFEESFGNSTDSFIEENGRKLFLLYIRPLINGTGNYYIESRTRSMGRTDLIIDYHGLQYIPPFLNGQDQEMIIHAHPCSGRRRMSVTSALIFFP